MKSVFNYFWLVILCLLVIHGASVVRNEWKIRSIHTDGKMVEVKIEELNCPKGIVLFRYEANLFEKKIDARTCVILNAGQKIKLRHSQQYNDLFLFANERNPNHFILGGLEIILGLIGLLTNWPLIQTRKARLKKFSHLSDN